MTRKTSIPDLKISPDNEDANNLRRIARNMLVSLEDMKNRALSATDIDELKLLKLRIELLFGKKSLSGGLVELTDLLLKLTPEEPPKEEEGDDDGEMKAHDIEAMERYIERWKEEREPVSEEVKWDENNEENWAAEERPPPW